MSRLFVSDAARWLPRKSESEKIEGEKMLARSLLVVLTVAIATPAFAADVTVLNPSFELPVVDQDPEALPASPFIDNWTQTGQIGNSGVFYNTPQGSPDHIDNMLGIQAAFMSSLNGIAISQLLSSNYEVGSAYDFTVGIAISNSLPPSATDPLNIVFYYMDNGSPVDLATTPLTRGTLTSTHFVDHSVSLPQVTASDDWANQQIGIAIRSAGLPGGFWDLDNVRVTATPIPEPASLAVVSIGAAALLTRRRSRA
jgi:hypothetical protein